MNHRNSFRTHAINSGVTSSWQIIKKSSALRIWLRILDHMASMEEFRSDGYKTLPIPQQPSPSKVTGVYESSPKSHAYSPAFNYGTAPQFFNNVPFVSGSYHYFKKYYQEPLLHCCAYSRLPTYTYAQSDWKLCVAFSQNPVSNYSTFGELNSCELGVFRS